MSETMQEEMSQMNETMATEHAEGKPESHDMRKRMEEMAAEMARMRDEHKSFRDDVERREKSRLSRSITASYAPSISSEDEIIDHITGKCSAALFGKKD